jgi:hypothetical protein
MKRWMSLAVGIALVVASCSAQSGTDEIDEGSRTTTSATASTVTISAPTTIVPTTATTTEPAPTTTAVATTAAPTTTSAPPPPPPPPPTTTAAPATSYEVANPANPAYYPGPLPGAGIYFGSGCSPGTSTLPDGIWFGDITSVSESSFEFDLMCFAPLPEGSTEEDGIGDITNTNPTLRTIPVDPDSDVYVLDMANSWVQQPYSTWHVDPGAINGCPLEWCSAVWLYVNGGEATEIMVIWTP